MVVDKSKRKSLAFKIDLSSIMRLHDIIIATSVSEVEDCFKRFLRREDIDIILINQTVSYSFTLNILKV